MKYFLIMLTLTWASGLMAQKKNEVKLYAFRQEVSKGISPAIVHEQGETKPAKTLPRSNELIYLEIPIGWSVHITDIWIKGEKYSFDTSRATSPVVLNTGLTMPGQQEKILITTTSNQLFRIIPRKAAEITETNKRSIVKEKEVVVYFRKNGRLCRKSIDKMTEVENMVMQ